ncbi:MAG: hypothetical protein CSA70_12285 [Rhodobacterales bacterium]|nr:MAG: hypothetical protein CSA70_12285 [Rhodobacterales bacterium]
MIQFTLKCENDHRFQSWFQSSDAFDSLRKAAHVTCVVCGSDKVEKAIMAPRITPGRNKTSTASETPPTLSTPDTPAEQALVNLKKNIEQNSEYVGMNFATEARAIHDGDSPERAIYGEAKPDEARQLIEDGVPVAPLPFIPGRKSN